MFDVSTSPKHPALIAMFAASCKILIAVAFSIVCVFVSEFMCKCFYANLYGGVANLVPTCVNRVIKAGLP